ncbi:MAG TPA: hypothetical protein VGO93_22665 [Candidatus Xenobia bacterium]|jgi:hypothetical protein
MRRKLIWCVMIILLGLRAVPCRADDTGTGSDPGSAAAVLLYELMLEQAKKDPKHTLFTVDNFAWQAAAISGNLNRVAQYLPLDTGMTIQGLFFQRDLSQSLITAQLMYAGPEAYRLSASINRPDSFKVDVLSQSVLHRLEHDPNDINIDHNPGTDYSTVWQHTQITADKSLTKDGQIGLYGGYSYQGRSGAEQHSFFELHRFNCTDCHTQGFMQAVGQQTADWNVGLRAHFSRQQLVVDGNVAASNFVDAAPPQTYNFGPPFGISALYPNPNSQDNKQELQAYLGEGSWRLGVHLQDLQRTNQATGQTLDANHLSVQGATALAKNLTLSAGLYSEQDNNSIPTNLSSAQQRLWIQAAWRARKTLNVTVRAGEQTKSYSMLGQFIPNAQDSYWYARADYRPGKRFYLSGTIRNDTIDHPYFATDFASRTESTAEAVYTAPRFVVGGRYDYWYGSNTVNDMQYSDFNVYASTPIDNGRIVLNASYDKNDVGANNQFGYFFSAPVFPALGSNFALFDQLGFPYTGQTSTLMLSATVPIGKKHPWRLTPTYRMINSNTFGSYLINLPGVALNSLVDIQQYVYGLRLDVPLRNPAERLGFGWENDNWNDGSRPMFNGSFDLYNLYLTKRY